MKGLNPFISAAKKCWKVKEKLLSGKELKQRSRRPRSVEPSFGKPEIRKK